MEWGCRLPRRVQGGSREPTGQGPGGVPRKPASVASYPAQAPSTRPSPPRRKPQRPCPPTRPSCADSGPRTALPMGTRGDCPRAGLHALWPARSLGNPPLPGRDVPAQDPGPQNFSVEREFGWWAGALGEIRCGHHARLQEGGHSHQVCQTRGPRRGSPPPLLIRVCGSGDSEPRPRLRRVGCRGSAQPGSGLVQGRVPERARWATGHQAGNLPQGRRLGQGAPGRTRLLGAP